MVKPDIIGPCTLYLGDSFDVADEMNELFDALVIDPPFGIGFDYDGKIEETRDPESYWWWFGPIYKKLLAKVNPGGFVSVWQTQLYFKHFWEWFGDNIHVYAGCKNFVQLRKTPINYGYDPIIMFYKEGAKPLIPSKQSRSIDYFVADTAHFGGRDHPCPRALGQVDEILSNFTVEGAHVLDGFMGWATAGVSCIRTGRKFTGIEKDGTYYDSAVKRIKKEWNHHVSTVGHLDTFIKSTRL
jgi:DNA modification methylase